MPALSCCDRRAQFWRWGWSLVFLLMLILVTACEEEPGAIPPISVGEGSTPPTEESADEQNSPGGEASLTEIGDFEFSAATRPSARHVYFPVGDDLWMIGQTGTPETVVEDVTIVSYSSSARGDRLALLGLERDFRDTENLTLTIFSSDEEVIFSLDMSEQGDALEQMSRAESVSVNPAGDALSVIHQNGAMSLMTLDGESTELLPPSIEHQPGRLTWSADGQFIAYLDPWLPDQPSALYVTVPGRDIRQALVQPSADGEGVVRAQWIPGTTQIALVRSSSSTISRGGDLFLVDAETGQRELLMSSGAISPVAGLVDIAPSPDGIWLATTGFVPSEDQPRFAGLWMINLQLGVSTEIELDSGDTVTDLWWLGDNLLVRTIDEPRTSLPGTYTGREAFRILEIDPESGSVNERYAEDEGDPD